MAEDASASKKMKRKLYEKELRKLQVELCHLQQWVKAKNLRAIILFEGRDTAGKGGTIKAITERVSPRIFRVVALPAPSDREKAQMFFQRYMRYFPAAGEVVIFDRSWYNRAGVEYVMGFCTPEEHKRFLTFARKSSSILSMPASSWSKSGSSRQGGTGETFCRPDQRSAPAMEAEPDGRFVVQPLVRLLQSARRDVQSHEFKTCAVVRHPFERQAPRAPQLHLARAEVDTLQTPVAGEGHTAKAVDEGPLQ